MMKYWLPLVLLVFLGAINAQEVNWSTLTSQELSQLPHTAFINITAEDLASIPVASCWAFSEVQLTWLPVEAAPGFTSAQISQLGENCQGFYGGFMGAMVPEAFAGLTKNCIGAMRGAALTNWTAAQVAQIPGKSCAGFTPAQIPLIDSQAFAGLNHSQLSNFTYEIGTNTGACAALLPAQIQNMPAPTFSGFTTMCVQQLANMSFSLVTAEQFSYLTPFATGGLTSQLVSTMNPAAAAGFSAAMLETMVASFTFSGCQGFTAEIISNIPAEAFAGWQPTCVNGMPSMAWSNVTQYQIGNLTAHGVSGLTASIVFNLPAAAGAGWSAITLASVPGTYTTAACSAFQSAHVAAMPPAAFAGWTYGCTRILHALAWNETSAQQIAQLNPNGAAGLPASVMANIPALSVAGFTTAIVAGLTEGCAGLTPAQFNVINTSVYAGFTQACVSLLSIYIFRSISAAQFNSFPTLALPGITAAQTANIPQSALTYINISSFSYLSMNGVDGFTPYQLALLIEQYNVDFTNMLTTSQLSDYSTYNLSALLEFKSMIPVPIAPQYSSIPAPNTTWLQLALSPDLEITTNTLESFTYDTLQGITTGQAPLVDTAVLTALAATPGAVSYLLPDTMDAFTCDQLRALEPALNFLLPASYDVYVSRSLVCPGGISISTHHSSSSGNPHHGLSGGQKAGITFGVLFAFGLVCLVTFLFMRYRQRSRDPLLIPLYNRK